MQNLTTKPQTGDYADNAHGAFFFAYDAAVARGADRQAAKDAGAEAQAAYLAWKATGDSAEERVACKRCSGTGEMKMYNHIMAGVCFRCDGRGVELTKAEIAAKRARQEAEGRRVVFAEVAARREALAAALALPEVRPVRTLDSTGERILAAFVARFGQAEADRRAADLDARYAADRAEKIARAREVLAAAEARAAQL